MRNRILLLLALASVLGTPVLLYGWNSRQTCVDIADQSICNAAVPHPFWVLPFGLIAAAALLVALILYVRALAARRRERELLGRMGVQVAEQDLPLDE